MNLPSDKLQLSTAERKRLLIAQGEVFRDGIAQGSRTAQAGLHPNALASGVWGHLISAVMSRLSRGSGSVLAGLDLTALLPLVISGATALSKRVQFRDLFRKPVLRGAIVLGVTGAAAMFAMRRKKAKASPAA